MSDLYGSDVKDPNFVLRFSLIVFMGIIAFGSVLFWRSSLLFVSQYEDMPVTQQQLKIKKQNLSKQKVLANKIINLEE